MSNLESTIEAEQCVLGCMILDNECRDEVVKYIDESDFSDLKHRHIMEAFGVNVNIHGRSDFILLRNQLETDGRLESSGGVDYLVKLGEIVPHTVGVEDYCGIVRNASLRRRVGDLMRNTTQTALDLRTPPEDALSSLIRDAEAMLAGAKISDDTKVGDDVVQNEMSLYDGSFIKPISCGYIGVDDCILGYHKSEMTVWAGRPGMGKTASMVDQIRSLAGRGYKVGVFSAEMKKQSLYERMIASISGVSTFEVKAAAMNSWKEVSEEDKQKRIKAATYIRDELAPYMWVDDTPGMTAKHIERVMADPDKRCDVLFIDHLHHISSEEKKDLDDAVSRINNLNRKYGHHTVLLAQINRGNQNREDKRPRLSDLKGSGAIEQTANNCIFIHRDEDKDPSDAIAIVAKARDGRTGIARLLWNGDTTSFSDFGFAP